MSLLVPTVLAMLAGASVVVQQALNAHLRTLLASPAWSGFASYLVGLIGMALLVLVLRDPLPAAGLMARVPWWAWSGGLFGAAFIALAIVLIPTLGTAAFLALLVAGQMLASLVIDHLGWLGLPQRPFDAGRLVGVALLIGGVALIRR